VAEAGVDPDPAAQGPRELQAPRIHLPMRTPVRDRSEAQPAESLLS
jgi:hypothetical protein